VSEWAEWIKQKRTRLKAVSEMLKELATIMDEFSGIWMKRVEIREDVIIAITSSAYLTAATTAAILDEIDDLWNAVSSLMPEEARPPEEEKLRELDQRVKELEQFMEFIKRFVAEKAREWEGHMIA